MTSCKCFCGELGKPGFDEEMVGGVIVGWEGVLWGMWCVYLWRERSCFEFVVMGPVTEVFTVIEVNRDAYRV